MRFSLRSLLIVMLLMGPLCALGWQKYQAWIAEHERQRIALQRALMPTAAPKMRAVFVRGPGFRPVGLKEAEERAADLTAKMNEAQVRAVRDLQRSEPVDIPPELEPQLAKVIFQSRGPVRKEREQLAPAPKEP